ncbi:MAG: hypothetical protein JWM11_5078, partial [Planctomycetaceae bacterium]|nr:hypothetical protein [Planctomycetaceae bacterium]
MFAKQLFICLPTVVVIAGCIPIWIV